jgi:hypothetical protein
MRTPLRLAAALLCASICAPALLAGACAATAHAFYSGSHEVSDNWSGYVVTAAQPFRRVLGAWVQPKLTCNGPVHRYAAFWVGLGGFTRDAHALEQIGTEADCAGASASAYAWYELLPAGELTLKLKVNPGDHMAASVSVDGETVLLHLDDFSTGNSFAKSVQMASPDTSSAEWIAEAPSACGNGNQHCQTLPLANFSEVTFAGATAATLGGPARTIESPRFHAHEVKLKASGIAFGVFGRANASRSTAQATPSALSGSGSSFTITWEAGASATPA